MQINDLITFDELIIVLETDKSDNDFKTAADKLLEALTDWPTVNLKEPSEIIGELKQQINGKLTYSNLYKYLKSLEPEHDAWKMEALQYLLDMFDLNKNNIDGKIELDEIIVRITKHYRGKS